MPKRALPTRPEAGYHDFLEEMEGVMLGESDRTIGILGRAYADALAEKLLHSFLVNGKVSEGLLHHSGVVGSFSARVDLCYALGLLPEATYSDLRFVREIGNYCAHHIEIGSFESSPLKDWCQCFHAAKHPTFFLDDPARNSARELYTVTMFIIAQEIDAVHRTMTARAAPPLQLPKLGIRQRVGGKH